MEPAEVAGRRRDDEPDPSAHARGLMVEEQIRARGVRDPRVLAVMGEVPRHLFVGVEHRDRAYGDYALPSLAGQTISQPYMVARMLELLEVEPTHRVLEIGTGTGYQTLLLARLAADVFSVERVESLLEAARERLAKLGAGNVRLHVGDGSLGWPDFAPYDRVLVAAAAPRVPEALREQLGERGLLVIPVGGQQFQHLETWRRLPGDRWERRRHGECRFVPLVGLDAWREKQHPSEDN